MMPTVRFDSPSASLSLKALLKRTRRGLWIGIVSAVGVHLVFTQLGGFGEEQKAAKPLTTRFVKRQPRFTRPFEMRKHPQPKRRRMQRTMVSMKAKTNSQKATSRIQPLQAMPNMAKPKTQVDLFLTMRDVGGEPGIFAEPVVGRMNPEDVVDMSLEMVDIEALDTGRYQAMIIQDPNDKRSIAGYFHFWMAWGSSYSNPRLWNWQNRVQHGVRRLVLKLSEWTDIKADIKGTIGFDSEELLNTPWVLLAHWFKMFPTDGELENICRYMKAGGFIFTEGDPATDGLGMHVGGTLVEGGCSVVRLALEHGGYEQFNEWTWERLPHSHPLFHCYFDFADGPPSGAWSMCHANWGTPAPDPPRIEAIEMAGRIAAITNNAVYNEPWGDWGPEGLEKVYCGYDPTRQLQFGVNSIIFALTQEGSVTYRLMASVQ